MKTGAEIMLGAVERFGNFLPEENLQTIHDSQACDCEMCRWADEVERRQKEESISPQYCGVVVLHGGEFIEKITTE